VLLAAMLALGVAGNALAAVKKGGTLYVKVKNTRLMESAALDANLLRVLQPGQEVKWLGADPKDKQWHQVEVGGKKGVVFQSNLSTKPPSMELVAGKDGVTTQDAATFANSGAAIKLLADGPLQYGQKKGADVKDAVAQLQQLKALTHTLRESDAARHVKQAGLFPVVGPSEPAAGLTKEHGR
jgi:uncharacterized protein YgiM (DUF1202 family)